MDVELGEDELLVIIHGIMHACLYFHAFVLMYLLHKRRVPLGQLSLRRTPMYSLINKVPKQLEHLDDVISNDNDACIDYLRMSRPAFLGLCRLLEQYGGLKTNRNVSIAEQVAMFLVILAHHEKNRIVKREYKRFGRTVSKYFHRVLNAIISVHKHLLAQPEAVGESSTDDRWAYFQGCLGALDGTYIPVRVAKTDHARYRNRKGEVSINVLGVCNAKMHFVYVLSGWEGNAADSRVLRDAVSRPNGLKVPQGSYYLCDNGYMNCPGFLTPYRGTRYHLDDWGRVRATPQNAQEYFNMKHCKARNVIERAFGLLKMRWAILRSPSFYRVRVHNRILMACCLLYNYIRTTMAIDPLEQQMEQVDHPCSADEENFLQAIETSPAWTTWRDNLATSMYNEWRVNN